MKTDAYAESVLTVIAAMLTIIAVKPLISPVILADAQSQHTPSSGVAKVQPEPGKVAWEYKMIDLSRRGGLGLQDFSEMLEDGRHIPGNDWFSEAKELGTKGWELVSATPVSNSSGQNFAGTTSEIIFVFKRQAH